MKFRNFVFMLYALAFLFAETVFAGDVYWNNAGGGNWNTGSNWNTGTVPQTGDDVHIVLAGTYTVTLDANVNLNSLEIGAGSGVQTLAAASRTIALTNGGAINPNGVINLTASTLSGGAFTNSGTLILKYNNTISANIDNAGTIEVHHASSYNTMTGALTTQPGSVLRIDGRDHHAGLTISNGFLPAITAP